MTDVFTKEKRSAVMSRIRGGGNASTELLMIQVFKEFGIKGWRRSHQLFGRPDFVFLQQRVAVFVDGDFWHGHPTLAKIPRTNREFWLKKIEGNRQRDRLTTKTLRSRGWTVIRVWESDLRISPKRCAGRVQRALLKAAEAVL